MAKKQKHKILILLGPTSSGKTSLAIHLAKHFDGEVISADSRQVYKGLNLGTGKVTKREMAGVPHHLLDVQSPKRTFSASDFKAYARKAITDIISRNKLPIVAGGTGFYTETLAGNVTLPEVPPNEKLRAALEQKSTAQLFALLKQLDPHRAKTIEPDHKRRLIRAIEIAKALGSVPPTKRGDTPYDILWIGIDLPDSILKEKIHMRLKERIRQGMLAEGKKLHAQGLSYKRMEALGLEYRYLALFLKGKLTREEFEAQLENAIWKYVKRQRRWFRRNKDIQWFVPKKVREIEKKVKKFLT